MPKRSKMLIILLLISSITVGINGLNTIELSHEFNLAALQVIGLHTNSFKDDIDEELPLKIIESKTVGDHRSRRSVPQFFNIPVLDNSSNHMEGYIVDSGAAKITEMMNNLKERFIFQQTYLQKIVDELKYAIKPNSNQFVITSHLIRNMTSLSGIIAAQINPLSKIILENSRLNGNDLKYRLKELAQIIGAIEQRIKELIHLTNDVILKNKPAVITGHNRFVGHNEISSLRTTSTIIGSIGSQEVGPIMNNLYRKSRPQILKGVKHVLKAIFVKTALNSNLINGIDFNKQIVTTNRRQLINSLIVFNSQLIIRNDLIIRKRLNNLNLDKDLVFLNRPETIIVPKVFTSPLIIAQRVNCKTIDGIDLMKELPNVLLSNGLQTIGSHLVFIQTVNTNNIVVNGMVNNIDISLMADQLVYKSRSVPWLKGRKIFVLEDAVIKSDINIKNRLDGYLIPEDLVLKNRDQIITVPKHFRGITKFYGRVLAIGLVDGLSLPQDIVTLTRNETIFGPMVFRQSITAKEDIVAHRSVDGIDLSDLKLHALKRNDRLIESNVRFHNIVNVGIVELGSKLNGIDLRHIFSEAIFKDNPNVEIIGTKFFDLPIHAKQMLTKFVNSIQLHDLVSTHKNETIFSSQLLTSLTTFNSIEVQGLIGKTNFPMLYNNRISLSKPQTVPVLFHFFEDVSVDNDFSVNQINGFYPQKDFVLKSKYQLITGPKVLVGSFRANGLIVSDRMSIRGRINNISINDINSRRIPLNVNQTHHLSITCINCNSTFVELFDNMNGLNIRVFANNVMSLTKPQTVFAAKHLSASHWFTRIESSKGINGISLYQMISNAIHLNGWSHIRAPFTFTHTLALAKPFQLKGVINGVNISYMSSDSVYKTSKNIISGRNEFKSGFGVDGNIHAFSVNDIDLSNELWTNNRDHQIKNFVIFMKSLNVKKDIVLNSLINGIDLSEFNKILMKTNNRNTIIGNLELIGTTKVLQKLIIGGYLNGNNLTQVFTNAVLLNLNQYITGIKTLKAPLLVLNNLNTSLLNEFNVPKILDDIVYINSIYEQHITALKTFINDITGNGFIQTNGIAIMNQINGVDLNRLNTESIKTNIPTILVRNQHFRDFSFIANNFTQVFGKINGIDLMRDVILSLVVGKPQELMGRKTFENVIIDDNVHINGFVNDMSLKEIEMNTVFTTNIQRVLGHKLFKEIELNSFNNEVLRLNEWQIPEDFVSLIHNQNISALLVFNKTLIINKNLFVDGLVSGLDMTSLATESLLRDRPQPVKYAIQLEMIVFRGDVSVDQDVDRVYLKQLSITVNKFTSVVNTSKDLLLYKANRYHFVSDYIYKTLEKSVFEIFSFDLFQSLNEIHGNHMEFLPNNVIALSETIERPTIHTIKYNSSTDVFDVMSIKQNPHFIQKTFFLKGEEFVIHINLFSLNFSSHITKSGKLIAPLGYGIHSVQVLNIDINKAILVSFQSSSGKLIIHSLESLSNNKHVFTTITESIVGTDTAKVMAFLKQNQVHIVVTKVYGFSCVIDSFGTLIFVLKNNQKLELIQKIALMNVRDVVHFKSYGRHYLVLSDRTSIESSLSPQTIYIYRSEQMKHFCGFSLFQRLVFDNVLQLSSFTYGTIHYQNQYLVAVNASNIMIWRQKGESGFADNWVLNTRNARTVAPVMALGKLYLIVGQSDGCKESLIFKAETRGMALAPLVFKVNFS